MHSQPDSVLLSAEEVVDIHIPLSIVEQVVRATTAPGDRVLDPFAGYGTTLLACENSGRRGVGVELLPEHVHIATARAPESTVIEGDARGLHRLVEGQFALCFTAPPFRTKNDHPHDPLTGYELEGGDYAAYLDSLTGILRHAVGFVVPGGYLVLNVANIRYRGETTLLAWDVATRVKEVIPLLSETIIVWDEMPHDFTGDYLLCFQKGSEAQR